MVEMKHSWLETLFMTWQDGRNTAASKQRQSDVVLDTDIFRTPPKAAKYWW